MNAAISPGDVEALLRLLDWGLVSIRAAAAGGDAARAEAIADALHNVPFLLREGDRYEWSVRFFREVFLGGLIARYPEYASLEQLFRGA